MKTIITNAIILFFLFLIQFSSLGQSFYYYDNGTSLLNFSEKNDLKIATHFTKNNERSIQIGYSPLKHLNFSIGYFGYNLSSFSNLSDNSSKIVGSTFSSSFGFYKFFENWILWY